jgi:hypothetical protein
LLPYSFESNLSANQGVGIRYHPGHVWKLLMALAEVRSGPTGRARKRNEEQILNWKRKVWPAIKKSLWGGRIIVFADESGLS